MELTCGQAAAILASATPSMQFNVIGQTVGTTSLLANILCFVGDERCDCLQDATDSESAKNGQWSDAIAALVADCAETNPDRTLSGITQEAALSVCP